jgi:hypothetical protein
MSNFYHRAAMAAGCYFEEPEGPGVREVCTEVGTIHDDEFVLFAAGFIFGNNDALPEGAEDHDALFGPMLRGRNAATRVEYLTPLQKLMLLLGALRKLQTTEEA